MRFVFIYLVCLSVLFGANIYKKNSYVIDSENNLMWQDERSNTIYLGSQEKANEYCESLTLGGFSNWRLPTASEYEYIIDKNRKDNMKIHKAFFYVMPDGYWTTSRTWRTLGRYGYYFLVKSGTLYYENRKYPKFFRCIRDMQ